MVIQINKRIVEMQRACSDDETRTSLRFVHLNATLGRFEATNGHILSIIESDELRDLPASVLVRFGKIVGKVDDASTLDTETGIVTGRSGQRILCELGDPAEVVYPNVETVLPTAEPVYRIGLNAKILLDLAQSLKGKKHDTLELSFLASAVGPVRVRPIETTEGVAGVRRYGITLPLLGPSDRNYGQLTVQPEAAV